MQRKRFTYYTYGVIVYTLAVILFGAYVRATGSGAGCGSHWPTCNGQIIPRPEQIETVIEFTHRITSALAGLLVVFLVIWAFRIFPKGHAVRMGAVLALVFMITEGLIGAGLVLFELVADNQSVARTVSIAAHLINTFILLAFLTLTAWWARGGQPLQLRKQGGVNWLLGVGFVALLLLGASGAITALGDTLFPAGSLAEGVRQDFLPTAHFLIRLRVWHPVIAIITGLYLILASSMIYSLRPSRDTLRFSRAMKVIFLVQLGAGTLNLLLLAPVWMQLVHLLLADLVWIVMVLLSAAALARNLAPQAQPAPAVAAQPGD